LCAFGSISLYFLARRCSQIESTNQELGLGNKTLRRSASFR
jgi:hypothetical protein